MEGGVSEDTLQVREELRNPERGPDRGVSYYAGSIEPGGNVVFVFGSVCKA